MKKYLQFTLLFSAITAINAEEFQLGTAETREMYSFIQLQYGLGEGEPFSEIYKRVIVEKDSVVIRILGEFSKETNSELLFYYEKQMPKELEKALASSGNLHNPALRPLIADFENAFKTTNLFREIDTELQKTGYKNTEVEFEKYTIKTKGEPKFWVADIWLKFTKSPNQHFHPTQKDARVK